MLQTHSISVLPVGTKYHILYCRLRARCKCNYRPVRWFIFKVKFPLLEARSLINRVFVSACHVSVGVCACVFMHVCVSVCVCVCVSGWVVCEHKNILGIWKVEDWRFLL